MKGKGPGQGHLPGQPSSTPLHPTPFTPGNKQPQEAPSPVGSRWAVVSRPGWARLLSFLFNGPLPPPRLVPFLARHKPTSLMWSQEAPFSLPTAWLGLAEPGQASHPDPQAWRQSHQAASWSQPLSDPASCFLLSFTGEGLPWWLNW